MARSNITPEDRYETLLKHAAERGKEVTITLENVRLLMAETHCQYTGVEFGESDNALSLERVDNTLGYVPGNVVPVTVLANLTKSDFPLHTIKKRSINYGKRRAGAVNVNTDKVNAARRKVKNYDDQIARIMESKKKAEATLAQVEAELARSLQNVAEDEKIAELNKQIYEAIETNPRMGWKYITLEQKLKLMVAKIVPSNLFTKLKVKIKP